jgi:4-carboxymuconolactone decarboxylase
MHGDPLRRQQDNCTMRMRAPPIADSKNGRNANERRRHTMDKAIYDKGLGIRRAVLGDEYVDAALKSTDDFNRPLQDMLNEYCWGALWGREGLPRKTRSMLNLAMISVLNRPHELRAHVRGALRNGVSREEISEVFLQVMIYAGAPAAVDAFRTAREVFAELDKKA